MNERKKYPSPVNAFAVWNQEINEIKPAALPERCPGYDLSVVIVAAGDPYNDPDELRKNLARFGHENAELKHERDELKQDRERLKYLLAELNNLTPAVRILLRSPRITPEKIDAAMKADFGEAEASQ